LTGYSSSREELVASLKAYTSLLAERNEALVRISATSAEIRSTLDGPDTPDISDVLRRRDTDIACYSSLCGDNARDDSILATASALAHTAPMPPGMIPGGIVDGELAEIARSVIALREDSRSLADEVLACQSECEALLRTRVESTSKALRRSAQRRKLDAAYGPALHHESPTFMDKQR
jgi:hypothetical protein